MNKYENIACLAVVYNKSCADSLTCKTFKNAEGVKVIIADNSIKDFGNAEYCKKSGWTYINNEGNIGLSKAYNKGIEYLQREGFKGYICLFDDDSEFDVNYFECIAKWGNHDADTAKEYVILPIVYSGETIISPCRINSDMQTSVFATAEEAMEYSGNDITGINSAMVIPFSIFDDYRYDENIFLDGIDHKFINDMKNKGVGISVIDYEIHQNFSGNEKPSRGSALTRFGIYAKDMKYIMQNNIAGYKKLMMRRVAKLSLTYRSFVFLKTYFDTVKNK